MKISRREFLKYCIASAATLGLNAGIVTKFTEALAADGDGLPNVIWLSGAACTGCTVSLANRIGASAPVDVADLLINHISLEFQANLMAAAGDLAVENLLRAAAGEYVLVVEGGIPAAFGGHACVLWHQNGAEVTALDAVQTLAPNAIANLSVGTCASFGGVASAAPNPTGVVSFSEAMNQPTINIPGCPPHPDWIVWTIAQLLAGIIPDVDQHGRPAELFLGDTKNVHKRCPRREADKTESFGVGGRCLRELGCNGPNTQADCPIRQWNDGSNWCIGANSICLACTEDGFPDRFMPFYEVRDQWNGGDSNYVGDGGAGGGGTGGGDTGGGDTGGGNTGGGNTGGGGTGGGSHDDDDERDEREKKKREKEDKRRRIVEDRKKRKKNDKNDSAGALPLEGAGLSTAGSCSLVARRR